MPREARALATARSRRQVGPGSSRRRDQFFDARLLRFRRGLWFGLAAATQYAGLGLLRRFSRSGRPYFFSRFKLARRAVGTTSGLRENPEAGQRTNGKISPKFRFLQSSIESGYSFLQVPDCLSPDSEEFHACASRRS